ARRRSSRGLTGIQDSIDQPDRLRKSVLAPQTDLSGSNRVHGGVDPATQLAQLARAEHELADGRLAAPEDEVVGPEARHLDLRLLDREEVLDRLGERPVAVLERRLKLAQLVFGLREREPAVDVDSERLGADVLLRDIRIDPGIDPDGAHR